MGRERLIVHSDRMVAALCFACRMKSTQLSRRVLVVADRICERNGVYQHGKTYGFCAEDIFVSQRSIGSSRSRHMPAFQPCCESAHYPARRTSSCVSYRPSRKYNPSVVACTLSFSAPYWITEMAPLDDLNEIRKRHGR
jgi:hypothetical protein